MVSSLAESFTIRPPLARRTLLKRSYSVWPPIGAAFGLPALAAAVGRAGVITAAGATGARARGTSMPVTLTDRSAGLGHQGDDRGAHRIPNPPPGVPQEGQYALGWGVVKFDWAHNAMLQHNGSNGMNFAKILVDPVADLAVLVLTNFPGPKAEQACHRAMLALYRQQLGV